MSPPRILIQFDTDTHASVFDAVVAVDSQVEHLLQYPAVDPSNVLPLIHGAMFTRGPKELSSTAVFVGGSNVGVGEAVACEIRNAFFGPMRVSVMLDGNGSNTTASAAVLCAARHVDLQQVQALILGGTGPVGGRIARLLLSQGAQVRIVSRQLERAESACAEILKHVDADAGDRLQAVDSSSDSQFEVALSEATAIFGCGAAGVCLLDEDKMALARKAQVAIDLNAVPPAGLAGVQVTDKATERGSRIDYGAIGVGGLKMRIHRAAIQRLFSANDLFLDVEEIFAIGEELEARRSQ